MARKRAATMPTAIVIPVELGKPIRQQHLEKSDLDAYRQIVGGNLEVTTLVSPPASLYVNEEGKLNGLAFNHRATALLWVHNSAYRDRDVLVGPAFILGPPDRRGDDTSAPEYLVELLFDTERYRVQAQTAGSRSWRDHEAVYTDWFEAYQAALELALARALVDEVRVIPEPDEELLTQWLQIGRENAWIRHADDPPFTRSSFYGCQSVDELEERIGHGNWSLGTAFYYRDLCFINQVDGGDEWLTIRSFREGGGLDSLAFESITFGSFIEDGQFKSLIERLLRASKEDCRRLTY
jgi:hypothetical protein